MDERSILVIEDDDDIANLVTLHLADAGFGVNRIANGRDGLARVLEGRSDLLILDLALPSEITLGALRDSGLVRLEDPPKPPPVGQVIELGLMQADSKISQQTQGALDLRTSLGLVLAAGAILQLVRGRVAGPAATLGMAAYSLLARSGK